MARIKNIYLLIFLILFLAQNILAGEYENSDPKISNDVVNGSQMLMLKNDLKTYLNLSAENKIFVNEKLEKNLSSKSPWLAFFLSMMFPGTGQLYNGEYTKAAIQAGLAVVGIGLVMGTACVECGDPEPAQSALLFTGLGMAFGTYVWSLFDAPISANNINERIRSRTGLAIYNSDDGRYSLRFYRVPIAKSYTISLAVNF